MGEQEPSLGAKKLGTMDVNPVKSTKYTIIYLILATASLVTNPFIYILYLIYNPLIHVDMPYVYAITWMIVSFLLIITSMLIPVIKKDIKYGAIGFNLALMSLLLFLIMVVLMLVMPSTG
jgi:hypothetical protein